MSLRKHLRKLLKPGDLEEITGSDFLLKGGEKSTEYPVEITDVNEKVSIINLRIDPHSNLIDKDSGYRKICDYLILVPRDDEVLVLLCELKKTYKGEGGDQLLGSIPLVDYLHSMLRTHFDESLVFKHHFLIISSKYSAWISKELRPKPIDKIEYNGMKITVILGETIPFNRMLP